MLQEKFADDFPLRKTGVCVYIYVYIYIHIATRMDLNPRGFRGQNLNTPPPPPPFSSNTLDLPVLGRCEIFREIDQRFEVKIQRRSGVSKGEVPSLPAAPKGKN